MNYASFQISNIVLIRQRARASRDEAGKLQGVRQLLATRAIDLDELEKAISAVPRFASRLCQMVNDSGADCASVSDAVVLAGRAGIERLLRECSGLNTPLKQKRLEWSTRPTSTHLVKL